MSTSELHTFDVLLCKHVVGNVRWHLDQQAVVQRIRSLDSELASFLIDETAPNPQIAPVSPILLHEDELSAIAEAVRFLPLNSQANWRPYDSLYQQATLCTGEIRRRLAEAEAERWAAAALQFNRRLDSPHLTLADGIDVVEEWVCHLRRCLNAIGDIRFLPRPEGHYPTPSLPTDMDAAVESSSPEDVYVDLLREVINKHPDASHADPDELIKLARVNRQQGRRALRTLEQQGEYSGFRRPTPGRYKS